MIQFGLGWLPLANHASILSGSHQEEGAHLPTALQEGKHIRVAITHMDPHLCLRRGAHLLHGSRPHFTFPWPLLSLPAALLAPIGLAGSGLAHPGFLMQQSEHALALPSRNQCEHRMHEEAKMRAIANRSQAADGRTIAIVHLRVIMHQQHHPWLLLHLLACLLPDRATDGLMGDPIGSQQAVGRFERCPVSAHLARQTALGIGGHLGRYPHQACGSSWISYLSGSKRFLSPCQGIRELLSVHDFLLCFVLVLLFFSRDGPPVRTSCLGLLPLLPVIMGHCQGDRKGSPHWHQLKWPALD